MLAALAPGVAYAVIGVLLVNTVLRSACARATVVADVTSVRAFFVGGWTSYRALFNWLTPWILIPTFLVAPLFQILLFTYITARLRSSRTSSV